MVASVVQRGGADEQRTTTAAAECKTSRRRFRRHGGGGGRVSLSAAAFLAVASFLGRGAEAVSNGGKHSCSVFDDGTVKCTCCSRWGCTFVGTQQQ